MLSPVLKGKTSYLLEVFIQDNSKVTGEGLTGLAYNTTGLTCYYYRNGAGASVPVTLADMAVGTWVSGGFKEMDPSHMPGWYQLGVPDAALATGARSVSVYLQGAAHMVPLPVTIPLSDTNDQDGTSGGIGGISTLLSRLASALTITGGAVNVNALSNAALDAFLDRRIIGLKKNTAFTALPFTMNLTATNKPAAGATVTVSRLIDDGTFAAGDLSNVQDKGNGVYTVDGSADDVNGMFITLLATAPGYDDTIIHVVTVP
jgi:hypothetical protein